MNGYTYTVENIDKALEIARGRNLVNKIEGIKITCSMAMIERLERIAINLTPNLQERLLDVVRTCKVSDYKNPSELESAIMSLAAKLEGR